MSAMGLPKVEESEAIESDVKDPVMRLTPATTTETTMRNAADPIDLHVGARVRMRRAVLGLSQEYLAATVDLTFQQIQKYEKGVNRISASRLLQFARALHVEPTFFFDGAPEPVLVDRAVVRVPTSLGVMDRVTQFLSTTEGVALARDFTRIADPQVRRRITALIGSLAGIPIEPSEDEDSQKAMAS